jgi:hypothetical protein
MIIRSQREYFLHKAVRCKKNWLKARRGPADAIANSHIVLVHIFKDCSLLGHNKGYLLEPDRVGVKG